ncbi:DNA topoisomerase I [hydrothermal vent metagenome]|uniref:DNA topoisomerase n=1 Tax=hydrothermal vent metagenome TaxID=652676 RepID=A0A3B1CN48_9ZZZZ
MAKMSKSLVIVESPAKASTLKKYLGKNYDVMATVGHIKNLPKSKLGVDIENGYLPTFVTIKGKGEIIKKLKAAAKKADTIYLAPDPDREGEAIATHIAGELGKNKKVYRVEFNEITKKAVLKAMKNFHEINQNLANAQMARRVLDRLMGYKLSPLLWEKVRRGLSAGRVQSVALRLIVEREREIQAFNPVEYWSIIGTVEGKSPPPFEIKVFQHKGKKAEIGSGEQAEKIAKIIEASDLVISKIEKKERKRNPSAPFITSTLQQEASSKMRYSAKRTMGIAQKLYEGMDVGEGDPVGLITYMRTDSNRVSDEAVSEVRSYIKDSFGANYLPKDPIKYKTKKSAQDAHEAIRPTSALRSPESIKPKLSKDEFALYELIWKRFVSSQMTQAVLDLTSVDVKVDDYTLRASGSILKFDGFLKVYEEIRDNGAPEPKDEKDKRLPPDLKENDKLKLLNLERKQHFTQPPPRFSEAMLIRELEEKGIGRPSTYAGIMGVIQEREYCDSVDRRLTPSELGMLVTDLLVENFPDIVNVEFTAKMEEDLDQVEDGKKEWTVALDDFYKPFQAALEKAQVNMRNVKTEVEKTDHVCEKCGKEMVIKFGRFGKFLACSGYPECKNTKQIEKDGTVSTVEQPPDEPTDFKCEKCGTPMVIKTGRFGRFIACGNYPECKTTKAIGIGIKCPRPGCGGELTKKRSRRGKFFYGCDKYPDCDFAVWSEPVDEPCPQCEYTFLTKKVLKSGTFLSCANKECGYKKEIDESEEAAQSEKSQSSAAG